MAFVIFVLASSLRNPITRVSILLLSGVLLASATGTAQAPAGVDAATVNRIRGEAITRSQAMDTHWWLSEVYGPRATGTPAYTQGAEWVIKKFDEWGLKNIHIERFSIHMTAPQTAALIGQPRWNSPATNGPVAADVVHLQAATEADLAKYKGQLLQDRHQPARPPGADARGTRRPSDDRRRLGRGDEGAGPVAGRRQQPVLANAGR